MRKGAIDSLRVTVTSEYQENYSDLSREDHVFFYKIILENCSNTKVSLLGRFSEVIETFGTRIELENIIKEPLEIYPGQLHTLDCSCSLRSPAGKLIGHFEVAILSTLRVINIPIPTTELFAKSLLN
jgi:ApaG protein